MPPRFALPSPSLRQGDGHPAPGPGCIEKKSRDRLRMGRYQVLKMPPLRELPMPWRLGDSEEPKFWKGKNMATGGDLGLGRPPPRVQLEEVGSGSSGCRSRSRPKRDRRCCLLGLGPWRLTAPSRCHGMEGRRGSPRTAEATDSSAGP